MRARNGRGEQENSAAFHVAEVVDRAKRADLENLYVFWDGQANGGPPDDEDLMRVRLQNWMLDGVLVEERIAQLGKRLNSVVEDLMAAPGYVKSWEELASARSLSYLSEYDLEACIVALARRGLVMEGSDRRFEKGGGRVLGIPHELADGLLERRRSKMLGIFGTLTLRGYLEQLYSEESPQNGAPKSTAKRKLSAKSGNGKSGAKTAAPRMTPQRLRTLYKMYSQETASAARIERLPDGVRGLVEKAVLEFGGILPKHLFERMNTSLPHWNGRRWSMILEQSLIGTVCELDLTSYGIDLKDETLIVFNEVSLAWLRRVAVPGDPDRPHEELALGIDLITNVSRFLTYIDENGVRFTVRGEIFKTTEKKILQNLIPNPGRELSREEVLRFIFRFSKRRGLIDRTATRTFKVSPEGRTWGALPLLAKQQELLEFMSEERPAERVLFHQRQMRSIFLRMLKRMETGVWYDLMYLPFLARNNYLSQLDDLRVDEHFTERTQSGNFHLLEDSQRLAWNLVRWVRQRLYLLGMIDLGYDKSHHPVAMRITPAAARLLGMDRIGPVIPNHVGSLVVTPDFEVVLFPTGDDVELIHDLDRFAEREKVDSLKHFRVTQEGVLRALKNGMQLQEIEDLLDTHSRTPVPQNVRYSINHWALGGGLMRLDEELTLVAGNAECMRAFQQDAGTRKYIKESIDECRVKLAGKVTPRRLAALLCELGYLVELGPPLT